MRKLIQTRSGGAEGDNCLPAVIACFLDLESSEDCIQIQDHYPVGEENAEDAKWILILDKWLEDRGWKMENIPGHLMTGEYYIVTGVSPRNTLHVCIYRYGELFHDPHESQEGLLNELGFETLKFVGLIQ